MRSLGTATKRSRRLLQLEKSPRAATGIFSQKLIKKEKNLIESTSLGGFFEKEKVKVLTMACRTCYDLPLFPP